jgi:hypothetical protein
MERRGQSLNSFRLNSEVNDNQMQGQQDQQSSSSSSRATFSHTIRAHSILSASNLSSRRASGFIAEINATEEERNALVARFGAVNSFSNIDSLSADLRLRRASTASNSFSATSGSSTTNGTCEYYLQFSHTIYFYFYIVNLEKINQFSSFADSIIVKGIVKTNITRICVRTGDPFDVQLQFDVFAVLTPTDSSPFPYTSDSENGLRNYDDNENKENTERFKKKKPQNKKKNKNLNKKVVFGRRQIENMGVLEVQNMLEDYDLEEYIIEDDRIYNTLGIVNVGELVSQLLVVQLDPYPKKPGSQPVRFTFSTNDLLPIDQSLDAKKQQE